MPPPSHTDTHPTGINFDSSSPQIAILKNIIHTVGEVENLLNDSFPHRRSSPPQPVPPIVISLPVPCSITSKLLETGLDSDTIDKISTAFIRRAHELRESLETSIRQGCADLGKVSNNSVSDVFDLRTRLCQTVAKNYLRQLDSWTTDLIQRALELVQQEQSAANHNSTSSGPRSRRAFNHRYVPFLEHYFAENPLPTHADKNFLAKKCGMTFRQIHVWFQNRRNRTRKEGQEFKRKPRNEPLKLSLDAMIAKMPYSTIPGCQRKPYREDEGSEYEWQYESDEEDASEWRERHPRDPNGEDVLDLPAAPHAFPIPYPPYNMLFPEGWKPSFPPPQWERQATKPSTKRHAPVNFVVLTELFSKLSVAEAQRKRRKVKRSEADKSKISPPALKPDRSAATIFITTRPPCAPLPAMHKSAALPCAVFAEKFRCVPASPSRKQAFDTDTSSKPYTLLTRPSEVALPRPPHRKPSSPRKIAPLPRRVPKGTSITHRELNSSTPITPSPSTRKRRLPPSVSPRTASSDPEPSKRIRLSSDSSSGSGSGSEVLTPEQHPHALPVNIEPPVVVGYAFGRQMLNFADITGCQPYYGYHNTEFDLSDVLSSESLL